MKTTNPYKTWTNETLKETQRNYLCAKTHYNVTEQNTPGYAILERRAAAITTELLNREIKKEYKDLKFQTIRYLRQEWTRIFGIGDPSQSDRITLAVDILRAEYGNKKVDRAFNIK
tara:strand:+ start:192 stop:539 length:348 start_codon:yes stop_codon:yes gene_type:complete